MIPITSEAYKLIHDGALALSYVEAAGMRIDTDYIKRTVIKTKKRITKITKNMQSDSVYKTWKKRYGSDTNMGSREQLGDILFNVLKLPCNFRTGSGKPQANETALATIDLPFVKQFVKVEKLKKATGTYLEAILRETNSDGYMHPFFNLHLALTYRSSSDHPNFQNIPVRNPKIAKLIRRCFIARDNHQIIEVDYSGAEIACATCYHKDPVMIRYIKTDPGRLHTDMATQIFKLTKEEMTANVGDENDAKRIKDIRYCGKNMFVFPEFYGDFYINCAKSLWEAVNKMQLKTRAGLSLHEYLKSQGILKLGKCDLEQDPRKHTFELHLKEVENDFWNNRFKVYGQWKKEWWDEYQSQGYFDTLTGFRIRGIMRRNEVINYPVQGSAFHWLLWSLIRIQKMLLKYNMKSLIIGQIHDSIVGDVHGKEKQNYLEIVQQVMTIDIRKHWKWINVPLSVEAEVAPVGGTWYDKQKVNL